MKSFKQYCLLEKTFNINQDVDYIYNLVFKKYFNNLKQGKILDFPLYTLQSTDLPSVQAQKASKTNPVTIKCGIFDDGSFYQPNMSTIQMSINRYAINWFIRNNGNIISAMEQLPENLRKNFLADITGEGIKLTISHELGHWLDDSLHHKHLTTMLAKNVDKRKKVYATNPSAVNLTKYEINSQIQSIKQAKRKYSKIWDTLTMNDLFHIVPSVNYVYTDINNILDRTQWLRDLRQRMYREQLLGKKMIHEYI